MALLHHYIYGTLSCVESLFINFRDDFYGKLSNQESSYDYFISDSENSYRDFVNSSKSLKYNKNALKSFYQNFVATVKVINISFAKLNDSFNGADEQVQNATDQFLNNIYKDSMRFMSDFNDIKNRYCPMYIVDILVGYLDTFKLNVEECTGYLSNFDTIDAKLSTGYYMITKTFTTLNACLRLNTTFQIRSCIRKVSSETKEFNFSKYSLKILDCEID